MLKRINISSFLRYIRSPIGSICFLPERLSLRPRLIFAARTGGLNGWDGPILGVQKFWYAFRTHASFENQLFFKRLDRSHRGILLGASPWPVRSGCQFIALAGSSDTEAAKTCLTTVPKACLSRLERPRTMLWSLLSSKLKRVYATKVYQKVCFSGPVYCRKLAIKFSRIGLYQIM